MTISTNIPATVVIPGEYVTATSQQITTNLNGNVLLLGDITTNAAETFTLVTSTLAAQQQYGANSTLANMITNYINLDSVSTVYSVPVTIANSVPQIANALAAVGSLPVGYVVSPYSDNASVSAVDTWLNETTGRWQYSVQKFGLGVTAHLYSAANTTALITSGPATTNSKYITCFALANSAAIPQSNLAAIYAATIIPIAQANPGIPLNDLVLTGVPVPALTDEPSFSVRNTLQTAGYSTFSTNPSGQVVLDKAVTLHTTDVLGNPDTGWASFTTVVELEYVLNSLKAFCSVVFAGKKIITDPTLATAGTIFITTDTARSLIISWYQGMVDQGMCADLPSFSSKSTGVQVQINPNNGARFDFYIPITLASGLDIEAINLTFTTT